MEFLINLHFEEIKATKQYLIEFYKDENSALVSLDLYLPYLLSNLSLVDMKRLGEKELEKNIAEIDMSTYAIMAKSTSDKLIEKIRNNFDHFLSEGLSFIFYGFNGSGKTHFSKLLLYETIKRGKTGYYILSTDLQQLYNKVSFSGKATYQETSLYNHILSCDLLVIDEVGKETASDAFLVAFETVLKHRTARDKSTIQVTNLDLSFKDNKNQNQSEYKNRYGNSIYNLLFQHYKIICFSKHGDFRTKGRKEWF